MCQTLSVSRSGFYRWLNHKPSQRAQENETLVARIRQIHADSDQTYGSPRVTLALGQQGLCCSQKRVARLMKLHCIRSKVRRKFKVTTLSSHKRAVVPHLLRQGLREPRPNKAWASDITYIWTLQGWLYLAVFMDLWSRKIVGWSMSQRLTDRLVMDAFYSAWSNRRAQPGLISHSDRGSQYCSHSFKEQLEQKGYLQSMCSTGNCYDNAFMESFFATLKTELIHHERYETRDEARRSIFKYIEIFYNRNRIHSALGGLSPERYEQLKNVA
jgi:putative transposase